MELVVDRDHFRQRCRSPGIDTAVTSHDRAIDWRVASAVGNYGNGRRDIQRHSVCGTRKRGCRERRKKLLSIRRIGGASLQSLGVTYTGTEGPKILGAAVCIGHRRACENHSFENCIRNAWNSGGVRARVPRVQRIGRGRDHEAHGLTTNRTPVSHDLDNNRLRQLSRDHAALVIAAHHQHLRFALDALVSGGRGTAQSQYAVKRRESGEPNGFHGVHGILPILGRDSSTDGDHR